MPSRVIREGLLDSDQVRAAGPMCELLFVRLLLVADDYGRFDGRVSVIRSKCWPLGGPDEVDVFNRLVKLYEVGLAKAYEVNGKPFLYIPNFGQRMRAKRSKYPPPPDGDAAPYPHLPPKCPTDDGQMSGTRRPEAEAESESEARSGGGRGNASAHCSTGNNALTPPGPEAHVGSEDKSPAGMLAAVCQRNSITANAFHPQVIEWARAGVTVDQLRAAIAKARMRKPEPEKLGVNYLAPIVDDIHSGREQRRPDNTWRRDPDAASRKATEVGLKARSGEQLPELVRRIDEEVARRARNQVRE